MANMERPMTKKMQDFADHWLANGLNATASYKAVYKVTNDDTARVQGSKLLAKPNIRAYVDARRATLTEETQLTQKWVLDRLKLISDRSVQAVPVMVWDHEQKQMVQATALNDEMEVVGVYTFDSNGANKATELIGKVIGVFEKDNKQKAPPGGPFQVQIVPPTED